MENSKKLFSCHSPRSGSILVVSLWALLFFSILSLALYSIISSQIRLVKSLQERTLSPYLAKAAFYYYKAERLKGPILNNTLYGLGIKRERELGRGKFIFSLTDEEAKININSAGLETLARLPDLDEVMAQKIYKLKIDLGGAFNAIEELLLIDGFREEYFEKIKNYITIYGDGLVNVNTAPATVLGILGLNEDVISSIIDFRAGTDGKEGTEDDDEFTSKEALKSYKGFSEIQKSEILRVESLLKTSSMVSGLQIETQILNQSAMHYNIITNGEKIYRWSER